VLTLNTYNILYNALLHNPFSGRWGGAALPRNIGIVWPEGQPQRFGLLFVRPIGTGRSLRVATGALIAMLIRLRRMGKDH
jgi:hypothetical protein